MVWGDCRLHSKVLDKVNIRNWKEILRFFVGVSNVLLRDFEKEGSNVKADL